MSLQAQDIDRPEIAAELRAIFERYEQALVENDIETLDGFFWPDAGVLRFGSGENLYGIDAIRAFRQARAPLGGRELKNVLIHTFGTDFGTATTEFYRDSATRCGRQSQTWVRFEGMGWRIVSAHVSIIDLP